MSEVLPTGMFVHAAEIEAVSGEFNFELLDEAGAPVAAGRGRLVWLSPGTGFGAEFVRLDRGAAELAAPPAQPRPAPAARPASAAAPLSTRIRGRGIVGVTTIGIDLGTSNTCASAVIDGEPQVIPTRYGTKTIPSVLTLGGDGKILVGTAAARRMVLYPTHTVYGSKRLIGRTYRPDVADRFQEHFSWPIVETDDHRYGARVEHKVVSATEVAQHLLAEVRALAEEFLRSPVRAAVITVPAHFSEVQREAVREAGGHAGLRVARIVNEPTAAAVAYGFNRRGNVRLAVFDLGGGTFDFTVLQVTGNRFEVLASGGDNFLGGMDIDDVIAAYCLEQFQQAAGVRQELNPQQVARLREACEQAKCALSVQQRTAVHLPQFAVVGGDPRDLGATVAREFVEQRSAGLVKRMMTITHKVLGGAQIDRKSIDDVLLVGGMTRMPLVQRTVERYFGKPPSHRVHPDEAVAIGAAVLAEESDPVELIDVLPLSIGYSGPGRKFQRVLMRTTPVPAERSFQVVADFDERRRWELPLFQGERRDTAKNEYLGSLIVEDTGQAAAASGRFELTLALDVQCMLSARCRELPAGQQRPVRLERAADIDAVIRKLGPYEEAEAEAPETSRPSLLGRLFGRKPG
ncbi:MAG: Hsp70 family protein [Deltaproteobacteria bacterium]|nr:Hsp70 family protein [Deltaproteobacteria bacterium]